MRKCPKCQADIDAVGFYAYRAQFYVATANGLQPGGSAPYLAGLAYCVLCDAELPWKSWDLLPSIRQARATTTAGQGNLSGILAVLVGSVLFVAFFVWLYWLPAHRFMGLLHHGGAR